MAQRTCALQEANTRALVVEDSSTIRMILSLYLQKMNIDVVEAVDGRDGLRQMQQIARPDLILVDWNMPELDGVDFIRELRTNPANDNLPIIMVTTNSETEHIGIAMEAGANEYIEKPCTLEMLREKLDALGLLDHNFPSVA